MRTKYKPGTISICRKIRHFFRVGLFFLRSGSFLLKYLQKYEARKFNFWKYKKLFNIGARKFHFPKSSFSRNIKAFC